MFVYLGEMCPLTTNYVKVDSGCEFSTPSIMHCLQKAAALTVRASSAGLFLTRMVTFQQLEQFSHLRDMADSSIERKETAESRASVVAKILIFTMSRFDDDAIKGNLFICEVEASFKSQAMQRYLEDEAFCAENSE